MDKIEQAIGSVKAEHKQAFNMRKEYLDASRKILRASGKNIV